MEIKNRLFTYPVLCVDTDDYINSSFDVDYEVRDNAYNMDLSFDVKINCPSLEKLVRIGQAEFVIHIECSSTSFRKALRFETNQKEYSIPKEKINGEITLLATIIAKTKIAAFQSENLNEDYNEDIISFERGSILAYCNMPRISITKKYEELSESESMFHVIQKLGTESEENKPITFDLTGERIKIFVDEETYSAYINLRQSKHIALSLLVLPAVIYLVEELDNSYESYKNKAWLINFEKFCKQQGKSFYNDYIKSDKNSVEIAQELLNYPVAKAYFELTGLGI